MSIQLSVRMQAIKALLTDGYCLADVGTDHGYLPISLVQEGRFQKALAMDVREGPLSRAREHILQAGLSDRIETRLGDGLCALNRGEADHILIAGMGGGLITRILEEGKEKLTKEEELLLAPQSEPDKVRRCLERMGYRIVQEDMAAEDGKYYPMLRALPGEMDLSEAEALFGPCLVREKHPVLLEYPKKEKNTLEKIRGGLGGAYSDRSRERLREIEGRLEMIAKIVSVQPC